MRYKLTTRLMQQASHSSSPHTLQELDEETAEAADASNAWLRQENTATTGVKAEPAVVPAVEQGKLHRTDEANRRRVVGHLEEWII